MTLLPTTATVTEQPRLAVLEELLLEDRLPAEDLLEEDQLEELTEPARSSSPVEKPDTGRVELTEPDAPKPTQRTRTRVRG